MASDGAAIGVPAWRARGCLLGLATADALGAPLEFWPAARAAAAVDAGLEMTGNRLWDPGEWTDDTAMALALGDSIVASGGLPLDTDDLFRRYADWANSRPKDIGNLIGHVLHRAGDADDARRLARERHEQTGRTASNGTVMRAAPIALRAASLEQASQEAREDARLTNYDERAGAASAALCAALLAIANGTDPLVAAATEIGDHPKLVDAVAAARDGDQATLASLATSYIGVCWTTLGVGLYALQAYDSYEQGVLWAISLGGDTDTNAAVAGALLGCRDGEQAIPERWLTALRDRERIIALAEALANRHA